jgi:hypothetical protein
MNNVAEQTPHPWSKEALYNKAIFYLNEMQECERDDWKVPMWSFMALEFLARASLSHISPTLIAEGKNWDNLYYALGNSPIKSGFIPQSISTKEVFDRLKMVLSQLNPELCGFCYKHVSKRNEEFHTGAEPYAGVGESQWLGQYYRVCEVLLDSIGETLESALGRDGAKTANKFIKASLDKSAKSVRKMIADHRKSWNKKSTEEKEHLTSKTMFFADKSLGHVVSCPACNSKSKVTGYPESPPSKALEDDTIIEKQMYLPSHFECSACGLKISGLAQLIEAKIGDSYVSTHYYDAAEFYGDSNGAGGYEPDYNEPDYL